VKWWKGGRVKWWKGEVVEDPKIKTPVEIYKF
jgi:hypothetical protein